MLQHIRFYFYKLPAYNDKSCILNPRRPVSTRAGRGWSRRFNALVAILSLTAVLFSQERSEAIENADAKCEQFVRHLLAEDYRTFFAYEYVSQEPYISCGFAHKKDADNPVFKFGLAKSIGMFPSGETVAKWVVQLLREAASGGYEPAMLQLLRYMWDDMRRETPFLIRQRALQIKVQDDPIPYIDKLIETDSLAVSDFLTGFIVTKPIHARTDLAYKVASRNAALGRPKAMLYLGMLKLEGYDYPKHTKKEGLALVRKAAEMGIAEAQIVYAQRVKLLPARWYPEPYEVREAGLDFLIKAANTGHGYATQLIHESIELLAPDATTNLPADSKDIEKERGQFLELLSCQLNRQTKSKLINRHKLPVCVR